MRVVRIAAGLSAALVLLAGCGNSESPSTQAGGTPSSAKSTATSGTSAAADDGSCSYPKDEQPAAKDVGTPPSGDTTAKKATLHTDGGDIAITFGKGAHCTVNSFAFLASKGYYDNTPCHRLTTSPGLEVLQCGDPSGKGSGGPGYTFADENSSGNIYKRGVIAMANAGPDTNGSQFFIIYGAAQLPPNYTVFGQTDEAGLAVVDKVAAAGADDSNGPGDGAPKMPISIKSSEVA